MKQRIFIARVPSFAAVGTLIATGMLVSWPATCGVVVASWFATLVFLAPTVGFFLLVIARSSLDRFGDVGVTFGPVTLNLAGCVALALVGIATWVAFSMQVELRRLGRVGAGLAILTLLAGFGTVVGGLTLGSGGMILGVKETLRCGSVLAVFFAAFTFADTNVRRRRLVRTAFLTLPIPCAVAVVQAVTQNSPYEIVNETLVRVGGTFVHPNSFALYAILFLLVGIALWTYRSPLLPRWAVAGTVVVLLVLLILSYSRSRWIAALIGLAVLPGVWRHAWRWALLLALVAVPFGGQVMTRFSDIPLSGDLLRTVRAREVTLGRGESQTSTEWRLLNALVLTRKGLESPWVGYGARTTEYVTPLRALDESGRLAGYAPHNDVVETFVEYGILGLVSMLLVTALIFSGVRGAMRKLAATAPERGLGAGLLSAGAALIVAAVTGGHVVVGTAVLYGFGLMAGVVVRAADMEE